MERAEKVLVTAFHSAMAVLTALGTVAEAKQFPDDLERAVQVPCQDSLTEGSQEPPDEGSAPRAHWVNADPARWSVATSQPSVTLTPARA